MKDKIKKLIEKTNKKSWQEALKIVVSYFDKVIFSTSFSMEDQIITDQIIKKKLPVKIFTLDTGRLPKETYEVWQKTIDKYQIKIQSFYPNQIDLEKFITAKGINSFYKSIEVRHQCCNIRKIEPLKRALKGQELWLSGLRKEHSEFRVEKPMLEHDGNFNLIKFYPVLDLTEKEVLDFIKDNAIPYNNLYDAGYKSIGCDPCTRATESNEKPRDGRWWWEKNSKKECGLHMVNGKLFRKIND